MSPEEITVQRIEEANKLGIIKNYIDSGDLDMAYIEFARSIRDGHITSIGVTKLHVSQPPKIWATFEECIYNLVRINPNYVPVEVAAILSDSLFVDILEGGYFQQYLPAVNIQASDGEGGQAKENPSVPTIDQPFWQKVNTMFAMSQVKLNRKNISVFHEATRVGLLSPASIYDATQSTKNAKDFKGLLRISTLVDNSLVGDFEAADIETFKDTKTEIFRALQNIQSELFKDLPSITRYVENLTPDKFEVLVFLNYAWGVDRYEGNYFEVQQSIPQNYLGIIQEICGHKDIMQELIANYQSHLGLAAILLLNNRQVLDLDEGPIDRLPLQVKPMLLEESGKLCDKSEEAFFESAANNTLVSAGVGCLFFKLQGRMVFSTDRPVQMANGAFLLPGVFYVPRDPGDNEYEEKLVNEITSGRFPNELRLALARNVRPRNLPVGVNAWNSLDFRGALNLSRKEDIPKIISASRLRRYT